MDENEISNLFFKDRFPKKGWKLFTILLYSPFGLTLALLRLFILIQAYVAAAIIPEMSSVRRTVLRILNMVLGIVVQEENRSQFDKKARVIVANHITYFDHVPLHLATGCIAPSFSRITVPLTWGLKDLGIRQGKDVFKENIQAFLSKSESPLLIYPEEETTSGIVGLLKFSPWYGFISSSVQPACLTVWKPPITDIAPNILDSSAISDLFWLLFSPFTVFKIKYLPVITRNDGETDEEMIARVETAIAEELGVINTQYTAADKGEYQKRCIAELNNASSSSITPRNSYELQLIRDHRNRMAAQVSEVLPHVPMDVIIKDLNKTKNVDLTISNILEGSVHFTPLPVAHEQPKQPTYNEATDSTASSSTKSQPSQEGNQEPSSSFSKSAQERMLTLAERKAQLIEAARKRYKERHGLDCDS